MLHQAVVVDSQVHSHLSYYFIWILSTKPIILCQHPIIHKIFLDMKYIKFHIIQFSINYNE